MRVVKSLEAVAGNGLIDRRALLGRGMVFAGAMGAGIGPSSAAAGAEPLADDPWSLEIGDPTPPYQMPSKFEAKVVRTLSNPNHEPRNSHAARRTICSRERPRRTGCISPSITAASPPSIRTSIGW